MTVWGRQRPVADFRKQAAVLAVTGHATKASSHQRQETRERSCLSAAGLVRDVRKRNLPEAAELKDGTLVLDAREGCHPESNGQTLSASAGANALLGFFQRAQETH
jgi:hypothetical protein